MKELRIVCSPDGCRIQRRTGPWPFHRWAPIDRPFSYMGHRFELQFPDLQSAMAYLSSQPAQR